MTDCIFCKIINKEISANLIYEDGLIVAFNDVHPQAPIHVLVIPKKHITTFLDLSKSDLLVIERMIEFMQKLIKEKSLDKTGYRLVLNGGSYQHVPHLHWHLLGDH
ncbi:MAG: HIT domain-containing protein [Patescibacteria group bacterium]|nr:HIT domain-containing protein [Patescibacteria group bacterium]